ncbi:MAG: hypothetical protein VX265_15940 [Myxococcota bacterium]|nr:hypothetical protein [Myxococcota bacterium]MEC8425068.1 hypothetical protein [Myxococcota bacterium]
MNRVLAIRILSVTIGLGAVCVAGGVTVMRHTNRVASDVITRPAPELSERAHVLLPDLDDAVMVVPDRPHDPKEVRAEDRFARITRLRTFRVSTNSLGMRSPELETPRARPRVLCLGDSVTFGWGVPYDDSWPARLAASLDVETINAGVPAMKPDSMAAWARIHAASLAADLVIFARRPDFSTPDPWGSYQRSVEIVQRAVAPAPVLVALPPVSTFDTMGAPRWQQERQRIVRMLPRIPVLDLTEAFRSALPRPGVVLDLDTPGKQRVMALPGDTLLLEVDAPGRGLAPEIVEMFESTEDLYEPLFFDGGHPTSEGFEVFNAALVAFIKEQGLPSR